MIRRGSSRPSFNGRSLPTSNRIQYARTLCTMASFAFGLSVRTGEVPQKSKIACSSKILTFRDSRSPSSRSCSATISSFPKLLRKFSATCGGGFGQGLQMMGDLVLPVFIQQSGHCLSAAPQRKRHGPTSPPCSRPAAGRDRDRKTKAFQFPQTENFPPEQEGRNHPHPLRKDSSLQRALSRVQFLRSPRDELGWQGKQPDSPNHRTPATSRLRRADASLRTRG